LILFNKVRPVPRQAWGPTLRCQIKVNDQAVRAI